MGRFDGGLSQLLRGDGRGHFTPVPPAESGLVVPGDAKALAVLELSGDGRPGFLVSRNNSSTLAFLNQAPAGAHSLCVRLKGPRGNPTGVGARVTAAYADGSARTAEVYAGSGTMSQSSPACFFGYSTLNPPRTVTVRWPSGAVSASPVPPGATHLVLSP